MYFFRIYSKNELIYVLKISKTCKNNINHWIYFDQISEKILRNVPDKIKKYVRKQLELLDNNFLDCISYWNEKSYRNGFVDGTQLTIGCFYE